MKKFFFIFLFLGTTFFSFSEASARGVIIYNNGEKIEVTQELPADLMLEEWGIEEHVNVGVKYDQFAIFWVPMWNYGETKHVLVNDEKDIYYDLSAEEIAYLNETYGLDISDEPRIGFWNKIGGKLIWGALLLFILWGSFGRKKDEDGEAALAQEPVPADGTASAE